MKWKSVDERLIREGELIHHFDSLENHGNELEEMNKGRLGPRFNYSDSYVKVSGFDQMPLPDALQAALGIQRILHCLVLELPEADYSSIKKRILNLKVDQYLHLS